MNLSTVTSQAVVQQLLDAGARHIVVSPGSRSAGLAWAAAEAQRAGLCRVHVRLDEREAGFLALGIAKAQRAPVAVIVTSGTAVANLLPAVVEAHHAGVPLVAVTADRPARLRGHGAPQTIDQPPIFAAYVAAVLDLPVGEPDAAALRATLALASGTRCQPVHLNVQFDLPLMPQDPAWDPPLPAHASRPDTRLARPTRALASRGVVVVGDVVDTRDAVEAGELAADLGWPLLWEPSANAHSAPTAVSHGPLIAPLLPTPETVITVGTVGLSRSVLSLLRQTPHHIAVHCAANGPDVPDPVLSAAEVVDAVPYGTGTVDAAWLDSWRAADEQAAQAVAGAMRTDQLSGPSAAVTVWDHAAADAALLVGASWPARHIEAFAPARSGLRVYGNRGANGIDGLISTAYGIGVARTGRTYALMGDVSFLYGAAGLVDLGASAPDLTIVVVDNDGSGIFSQLEQGAPEYAAHFDEVFGTPHGMDLWVVAEAYGTPACRVTTRTELRAALQRADIQPGVQVIVCTTGSRREEAGLIARIAAAGRG